ncbi:protein B4 [Coregonus clupeaformis]|uniref:protein B4 n=1 Tax=Coregonus clupeaformis TaxID=59861 RepID=UPI001E1C703F|nr:protein B4 [Coregonus clupeaformis]
MAPKKTAASEEVISSSESPTKDEIVSGKVKSDSSEAPVVARKTPLHPPTMMMVKEALKELDSRKGVSSQAIRSYITEKYPPLDLVKLKYMIRKALNKGIESGVLVRPPNSTANGAQGRFRLAVRGKVKEPKPKATENTDPNVKAAKAGAKKTKEKEAVAEKTTAKKQKEKTSEDAKPKKGPGGSKVAPAKKPKAKRPAEGAAEDHPKPKALKAAKKGEGAAKKGEGAAKKGEGAAKKGEGAAKKGEGAAKKGEGAAKKGEGAAKKGEGAAKKGEGAAKKGEGAAKKGEGGNEGDTVAPAARTTGKRGKKAAAE